MKRIAVTGATGQVGRELARYLQENKLENRLLVRNPERVLLHSHEPSTAVQFDFNEPETYAKALEGIDRLFLVCSSVQESSLIPFLQFACQTGVEQIVVMSGIGADINKKHFLARLEKLVKDSGIPYVALRANWFFQNFGSHFLDMIKSQHELTFPDGGASLSFVDARDIAEVALHFLTSDIVEKGIAFDITGPESLSHAAVAQLFSKHLPYEIGYRQLTESEAREELGWNDEWLELFKDIQNGLTAPVSDSVQKILGKPPRRFEEYIIDNKPLWLG